MVNRNNVSSSREMSQVPTFIREYIIDCEGKPWKDVDRFTPEKRCNVKNPSKKRFIDEVKGFQAEIPLGNIIRIS